MKSTYASFGTTLFVSNILFVIDFSSRYNVSNSSRQMLRDGVLRRSPVLEGQIGETKNNKKIRERRASFSTISWSLLFTFLRRLNVGTRSLGPQDVKTFVVVTYVFKQ